MLNRQSENKFFENCRSCMTVNQCTLFPALDPSWPNPTSAYAWSSWTRAPLIISAGRLGRSILMSCVWSLILFWKDCVTCMMFIGLFIEVGLVYLRSGGTWVYLC